MATTSSLVSRVRVELGDNGRSFVSQIISDGTTNRFKLDYSPVDAASVHVLVGSTDVTSTSFVEESTGYLTLVAIPADQVVITVSGTYYRYFSDVELTSLVTDAVAQHSSGHVDSVGRKTTIDTLSAVEEYPVAIYAVTLALYTLATDASFDIDIAAPDGVSIPRSERYRQLMDMVQARQAQYRDLCYNLGIGLYNIDVYSLRRISKTTGRYVPVYKPQEVDDRSFPQRAHIDMTTYGDKPVAWITEGGELSAYQNFPFSTTIDFTGDYWEDTFGAVLLPQRGSVAVAQQFTTSVVDNNSRNITAVSRSNGSTTATITAANHGFAAGAKIIIGGVNTEFNTTWTIATVSTNSFTVTTTANTAVALTGLTGFVSIQGNKSYTATISLTSTQTLTLADRTYWSLKVIDSTTLVETEVKGGNFFTERLSEVIL
jgi:hypothetical protein